MSLSSSFDSLGWEGKVNVLAIFLIEKSLERKTLFNQMKNIFLLFFLCVCLCAFTYFSLFLNDEQQETVLVFFFVGFHLCKYPNVCGSLSFYTNKQFIVYYYYCYLYCLGLVWINGQVQSHPRIAHLYYLFATYNGANFSLLLWQWGIIMLFSLFDHYMSHVPIFIYPNNVRLLYFYPQTNLTL